MTAHPNNTPDPGRSLPSRDQILTWIAGFLGSLPHESRLRVGPAVKFVDPVTRALWEAWGDTPKANSKAFVEDYMYAAAFKQLLEPERPLDDPWVLDQATELCAEVLRSRERKYRHRYGDMVEVPAAQAIGWLSLLEVANQLWKGKEIDNPRAYLRRVIEGDVSKLIEANLRQGHPGDYAFRVVVKKHDKRMRQERPDLDKVERRMLAATLAREEMARGCRFLERVAEEAIETMVDRQASVPLHALSDAMVEACDQLVADRRFTETDRGAWARFKAADFHGADVDWGGECSRRAGAQRLQALCRRLRRHLGDWT